MDSYQDECFEIVTSMRYDEALSTRSSNIYMPELHHQRLLDSAAELGWVQVFNVRKLPWMDSCEDFVPFIEENVQAWRIQHQEHKEAPLKAS